MDVNQAIAALIKIRDEVGGHLLVVAVEETPGAWAIGYDHSFDIISVPHNDDDQEEQCVGFMAPFEENGSRPGLKLVPDIYELNMD